MTEETNTATESVQVTTETSSEETQQVESQSTEQADTTQQDGKVTESMAMKAPEESEKSDDAQPTIDDIVNEALSEEGLSEETKKLMDENGLTKHIDMLVEGYGAIQEKNNQQIFDVVGGEESYKELQEWSLNSMEQEQRDSFNKALFSGDLNLAKLAVQGLQAQYVAANGKSPDRVIEGGGSANEANRPYADVDAYFAETRTIEYKRDPVYRAQVEAKRHKSGF